jgi:SAM-dependent methyltransferase
MTRNIDDYWDEYRRIYGFEEVSKLYREKKALEFLESLKPKRVLEVGCGFSPLFTQYKNFDSYVAIEPGAEAYLYSEGLAQGSPGVTVISGFLEDHYSHLKEKSFDAIVIPGVLHEVEKPKEFLREIALLTGPETSIYVNVPNANSLHRLIAVNMGLIEKPEQITERNISLSQVSVFTIETLCSLILEINPDFEIRDFGTFLLKPFTHEQMMLCWETKIITSKIMEGLYKVPKMFAGGGSEIFVVCGLGNQVTDVT